MVVRVSNLHVKLIILTTGTRLSPTSTKAMQTPVTSTLGDVHPKLRLQLTARCWFPRIIAV
eukprot:68888-Karenia_brevis.AAC.1